MSFRRAFFWLDDLSTGVTFLDDELEGLFERFLVLIDEMERDAQLSRFVDGMEAIARDIQIHFLHQEQVMRKIEYPEYKAHEAEHQRLVELLSRSIDNLGVGFSKEHLPAVARYFAKWFMSHVKKHDARIKQFLDDPSQQVASVPRTSRRAKYPHAEGFRTTSFARTKTA